MSASKLVTPSARQQAAATARAAQEQNRSQAAMATAAKNSRSLETDAVAVPDNLKQGYRREIFEKEEEQHRYSCGFCGKILREPLQAGCGHRFCEDCQKAVEESSDRGQRVLCKICKEEGLPDGESEVDPKQMFPDRGIKKEMMRIRTKCPNEMCVWTGPFKDYVTHETECVHQPLVCPQCQEHVSKHKMDQHKARDCPQRVVRCDHCHVDIIFQQKKVHLKECPKVPEACSQCNKNIPRDKMKKHQSQDCPNRMVTCPIEGCGTPQQQNRFSQHVQKDQVKHLTWVLSRISDVEEAVNALNAPQTAAGTAAAQLGATNAPSPDNVAGLKQQVEQLERQIQGILRQGGAISSSADGGATGGGGRSEASGQAGGGAEAAATTSTERVNAMEMKVNTLEPILSVLHGEMNRCIGAIEALERRLVQETRTAEEWRLKVAQYETTVSSINTTLNQRENRLRQLEALGHDKPDGTLLWKIANFSQVRKDALAGTVTNIHSRPFHSGPIGYKMCVRLYPNGDGMGKGTHLSLFFSIMRSPHDALLPWPFKQKVYFMLVDQNFKKHIVDAFRSEPSSSSFQRPTSEMNIATGCPMFVQLNKLTQPGHGYLKDDVMYIRVLVETDGLEEHLKQFDPRTMPLQQ